MATIYETVSADTVRCLSCGVLVSQKYAQTHTQFHAALSQPLFPEHPAILKRGTWDGDKQVRETEAKLRELQERITCLESQVKHYEAEVHEQKQRADRNAAILVKLRAASGVIAAYMATQPGWGEEVSGREIQVAQQTSKPVCEVNHSELLENCQKNRLPYDVCCASCGWPVYRVPPRRS